MKENDVAHLGRVKDCFVSMKSLLEKGWTKGTMARNAAGEKVAPYSDTATCFCLVGARRRACLDHHVLPLSLPDDYMSRSLIEAAAVIFKKKYPRVAYKGLCSLNDHPQTTLEDVLQVIVDALGILPDIITRGTVHEETS